MGGTQDENELAALVLEGNARDKAQGLAAEAQGADDLLYDLCMGGVEQGVVYQRSLFARQRIENLFEKAKYNELSNEYKKVVSKAYLTAKLAVENVLDYAMPGAPKLAQIKAAKNIRKAVKEVREALKAAANEQAEEMAH